LRSVASEPGEVRKRYWMSGQGCLRKPEPSQDGELKAVQYCPKRAIGSLGAKHLSERFNLKVIC